MRNILFAILAAFTVSSICISCSDSEKEHKFVEISELDFGEGTYRPNPFEFLNNIPPFSWMGMPDSVKKATELEISFNEDAIRSHSSGQLAFVDNNGNMVNGLTIGESFSEQLNVDAKTENVIIPVSFTVNPAVGDSSLNGCVVVLGNDLDQVNEAKLSSKPTPIASWSLKHKTGINWLRWAVLILVIALILAIVALFLFGLFKLGVFICVSLSSAIESLSTVSLPHLKFNTQRNNNKFQKKDNKKDDKKKEDEDDLIKKLLLLEKRLYGEMKICDKYDTLEKMRMIIDDLYISDLDTYNKAKQILRANTWEALEKAWELWHPTPKKNVEWSADGRSCTLKSSHSLYEECKRLNFLRCCYDDHGSPDFGDVTFPGSIVNISDLYDILSSDNIEKRGGSSKSLQEIAQERMAKQLQNTINKWAKQNNCTPDFYKWRDTLNLVPHEDTNCRTMRLVYRDAHSAFKHRGGVANAVNIKNRFS